MILKHLNIQNFRNIQSFSSGITQPFTVLIGPNGSGKTSFLEAIYFLGHGRSFRSQILQRVINNSCDRFTLHAQLDFQDAVKTIIGMEKHASGESTVKINGELGKTTADLAQLLPILLINPHSYALLEKGSKLRRTILDWGLFHVEQSYFSNWQKAQRILKQRNQALKKAYQLKETLASWDHELCRLAKEIDAARSAYLQVFIPEVQQILQEYFKLKDISLTYYRGWPQTEALEELLANYLNNDIERGFTFYGSHRADLTFKVGKHPAHEILSRGQQKLLLIAIKLAQGRILKQQVDKPCIYLLDDITAELDSNHKELVCHFLENLSSQVFITAVERAGVDALSPTKTQMFHVEHGIFTYE